MPFSRHDGIDIWYETCGAGRPLVLIHPLPFDHRVWLYQLARFSSRFHVIAVDLRGWGRSSKPHAAFALEDMGDDIMRVLSDEAIVGDAIVMGCSIGSKIALMLACEHPEIFSAAVLVGGNSGPQNQFDHRIAAYRDHSRVGGLRDYHLGHLRYGVTEAWADTPIGRYLLNGFADRGANLDPESIARVFGALTVSDLNTKLPFYRAPTLIVNGEYDNALAGGAKTAALISHARHHILPATGHCCFIEDPAAFDGVVIDFLAAHGLWPGVVGIP
jgi:3-oxoadipate enol-lactonase